MFNKLHLGLEYLILIIIIIDGNININDNNNRCKMEVKMENETNHIYYLKIILWPSFFRQSIKY
ncbi:hypothetical protein PIROE2DRAFT_3851 [Piromyces sp. E2]|nr:hypothetical protein PIROE2DRAFT_3851 [Piromyces sp. E2]|eukprot:OUM68408.1 hypothetical protein PIROE2DRAFT_3851 [Piromyces sp. E2]